MNRSLNESSRGFGTTNWDIFKNVRDFCARACGKRESRVVPPKLIKRETCVCCVNTIGFESKLADVKFDTRNIYFFGNILQSRSTTSVSVELTISNSTWISTKYGRATKTDASQNQVWLLITEPHTPNPYRTSRDIISNSNRPSKASFHNGIRAIEYHPRNGLYFVS